MNAVEIMARLRELYTKFPTLPCGDCHACCLDIRYVYISMLEHDMCPGFAWPQQAIRNEKQCRLLVDGKCTDRENRPFICHEYGTHADHPCFKRVAPSFQLSKEDFASIKSQYQELSLLYDNIKRGEQ
jgi:hypothetical protein